MIFFKNDFFVPNISNIPSNKDQLLKLIRIFEKDSYILKDLKSSLPDNGIDVAPETFRKMINHSAKVGILDRENNQYFLSSDSKRLLKQGYGFTDYLSTMLKNNKNIYIVAQIILILLQVFHPRLKLKTLYTIFSLIGNERTDSSGIASVGRNLRAIIALMKMLGVIERCGEEIVIQKNKLLCTLVPEVDPIEKKFSTGIINVNLVTKYLQVYFSHDVVPLMLSCIATYEMKKYIWTKSSLFKNQGEVRNLRGEYIMTVMVNKEMT